jgi:hypothetical protein
MAKAKSFVGNIPQERVTTTVNISKDSIYPVTGTSFAGYARRETTDEDEKQIKQEVFVESHTLNDAIPGPRYFTIPGRNLFITNIHVQLHIYPATFGYFVIGDFKHTIPGADNLVIFINPGQYTVDINLSCPIPVLGDNFYVYLNLLAAPTCWVSYTIIGFTETK